MKMNRQTGDKDRKTNLRTYRQAGRQIENSQSKRLKDIQEDKQTGQAVRQTDRQTGRKF
jgi:hypothetical protein